MKIFTLFICLIVSSLSIGQKNLSYEKTIQDIGDYAQHAPALTSLIVILVEKDKKGFWQFAKSYGTTVGVSYALKYAINKPRPDGRTDGHAFPSGHTAVSFSGASFLQRRYGWEYGIPAYVVAGFVAYSRIKGIHDRHDGWDVLGGIVVGVGSTYLFTTPYQKEHFALSFSSKNKKYLVGLKYKF